MGGVSQTTSQTTDAPALSRLRSLTGEADASFRPGQLEAIRDVVADRARVLCVQRTGWGKSAVYFIATSLLREAGAGPTLIVSPLLALMRNQIAAAERLGLRAHTINSTNVGEWDEVRDRLAGDTIDLLLISPERLNNPRFRETMLPLFAASVGLLVIDEAHCISDWGHDFRPDYRRVKDMLDALPPGVAVLGTTATANDRVVGDVLEQLAAPDGEPLRSYRGPLARTSLRLEVTELPRPAERLAWLVSYLPELPGSGIVYTLTKRDAEQVAGFLTANGISAVAYSGEQETDQRVLTEERLLRNEIKAVVATSALGMGYDKADLAFVVHYQAPGSVVSYYQQVGRAGRGVDHADVVLLRGAEDRRIQDFFIEQAFPDRERVAAVLAELDAAGEQGRTTRELMAAVNLGMGRIEAMLKILDVEGAVRRAGTRWQPVPGAEWSYDEERYARVTALRREEQRAMAAFGTDGRCLMRTLQEQLDDPGRGGLRALLGVHGAAFRGAPRAGARGGGATPPPLEPCRRGGQEDGPRRNGHDAQDPGGRPHGAGLGARPGRRRGMVAGRRAGAAQRVLRGRRDRGAREHPAPRSRPGGLGHSDPVGPSGLGDGRARRAVGGRAGRAARGSRPPGRGQATAARDGQRRPAGGERSWGFRDHRGAALGHRRAARRSARLGLDARDGRGAASRGGSGGGHTARARDGDVSPAASIERLSFERVEGDAPGERERRCRT